MDTGPVGEVLLELGRSGEHGTVRGVHPVLSGGAVVATLHASSWKEQATAVIGDREWVFGKRGRDLVGRWTAEPEDAVRLAARQLSMWKGTWAVELESVPVEVATASIWKGTHRYSREGRQVAVSGTTGSWSSRPTLTLDPSVPREHAVFLLWFELVIGRRSAAVAAAT